MVHYFGYGSNMSLTSLRAKGVEPLEWERAVLKDWKLTFSVQDFFAIEGGTGNIEREPGSVVHGVVYRCRDEDLAALDELEALGICYERLETRVVTYSGREVSTYVYVGLPSRLDPNCQPSARYLSILTRGAEDMDLDPAYLAALRAIEPGERPHRPPFDIAEAPAEVFSTATLAQRPMHTALAGAVFDMSDARPEHAYLQRFLSGRDVTVFFLKRMASSDGNETLEDFLGGTLTEEQRAFLDGYLHEFAHEYRLAGRMEHAGALPHAPASRSASAPAREVLEHAQRIREKLGHENYGALSEDKGFMPGEPPRTALPAAFAAWDQVAGALPALHRDLRVRQELDNLPLLATDATQLPDEDLLRACQVLAMLSHAYWYCETRPPAALPTALAKPWQEVRSRLGRGPAVLSYLDLIVYNWRLVDPSRPDPMRCENLRLLIPTVDNQEEQVFYLTQTEILAQCGPVVGATVRAQEAVLRDDPDAVAEELLAIISCLQTVVRESLLSINPNPSSPSYVDPVVWAKTVAPFAVPLQKGLQGPSGTSSPIFNTLDIFFGRKRYESFLGKEIRQLRDLYPPLWRQYLAALQETSVPAYVDRVGDAALKSILHQAVELYAGKNGFLGRHRMKVYGYLELAFKVGRSVTIGGFAGLFEDRTWDQVDTELETSRGERLESFPRTCHYARVKTAGAAHPGAPDGLRHIVLDVDDEGIRYEAGDRCAVLPENSDALVQRTLQALGATGEERVSLTGEWRDAVRLRAGFEEATSLTLAEVMRFGRIRPVFPRVAEALHALTQSEVLAEHIRRQMTTRWELWDLVEHLKTEGFDPTLLYAAEEDNAQAICRIVPPETFRPYSISSVMPAPGSGAAKELHLLVGRVRYESEASEVTPAAGREGAASSFLANAAGREAPVSILIEHPPRFMLPRDPRTPIVMFAGGTGISPFRSFLLERARQDDAGVAYLYLSLRSREHLLFQEELKQLVRAGKLELEVIFSRDDASVRFVDDDTGGRFVLEPGQRRYVHDLLREPEHAARLSTLLRAPDDGGLGASVYLCGRSRFAREVKGALKETLGALDGVGAVEQLMAEGRYMQEVFTDARSWDLPRKRYDVSDIASRNDDASGYWTVIDGLVYDVTEFIQEHPGGAKLLLGYAGMDSTHGYLRAHGNRSEVDAMREMYEIGAVRQLELGRVHADVTGPSGRKTVSLAGAHRMWVSALYLVVEMQNALRNDQSLQERVTTRDDPAGPRSLLKLQKGVETHVRFLESYLGSLEGPMLNLWAATRALFGPDDDPEWMRTRLGEVSAGAAPRFVAALTEDLYEEVDEVARWRVGPEGVPRLRVLEACAALERHDARLLVDVKGALLEGVSVFETYEAEATRRGAEQILAATRTLPRLLAEYYERVATELRDAGWAPSLERGEPRARKVEAVREMRMLLSTRHWLMEEDRERGIVVLKRTPAQVTATSDIISENEQVISCLRAEHATFGIVVDMREAPARNDTEFENAMQKLRKELQGSFARLAVLLSSAVGVLQVNRISRNEGTNTFATQSESAASRFAMGKG